MKNRLHFYPAAAILLILISCGQPENTRQMEVEPLPATDTLRVSNVIEPAGDSMLYNPWGIINVGDKYLVIYDSVNENFFKIYRLPEAEFLYSFGTISRGPEPEEFPSLFLELNTNGEYLTVFEGTTRTLRTFRLSQNGPEKISEDRLTSDHFRQAMNRVQRINDSLYIVDFGTTAGEGENEHIALKPGQPDSLFTFGTYPETDLEDDARYFEFIKMNTSNSAATRFAVFYFHYNRFKIYDEGGNLLRDVLVNDPQMNSISVDESERFSYRTAVDSTDEFIYTIGQTGNGGLQTLEIWTWEGRPVYKAYLDREIRDFAVAETLDKIYATFPAEDNKIYEFELPTLNE